MNNIKGILLVAKKDDTDITKGHVYEVVNVENKRFLEMAVYYFIDDFGRVAWMSPADEIDQEYFDIYYQI